jgi:hypothetical protein
MIADTMKHFFSIVLISKKYVDQISLSSKSRDGVFFEGYLGELVDLSFVNGGMLEIKGINGTFRIDISKEKLRKILFKEAN